MSSSTYSLAILISYLSCVMVNFVYGYKPTSRLDSKLLAVDAVARTITDADIKTQMIVDFFPFCENNRYKPCMLVDAVFYSALRSSVAPWDAFQTHC